MATPDIKTKRYTYRLAASSIYVEGYDEPFELARGQVDMINIMCNYDESFYPLFQLSTTISPKVYDVIVRNKDKTKFRIRLDSVTKDGDSETEVTEEIINDFFIPIITENAPFADLPLYEEAPDTTSLNADTKMNKTFYLYKKDDLINSKNIVNEVLVGNMSSVLCQVLGKNGFTKVLMSPPDNNNSETQVMIPPMNLINVFKYLETQYGIYSSGCNPFFDLRCLYVLNKSGHPNCYEPNENKRTIFLINNPKAADAKNIGTFEDTENREFYIYLDPSKIQIKNNAAANDHISGNNVSVIDAKKNNVEDISGAGNQTGGGITQVIQDNYSNSYSRDKHINDVAEQNMKMKIELFDCNVAALYPNKEFVFNFLDTNSREDYSGYYRPTSQMWTFSKQGVDFEVTVNMELTKKEVLTDVERESVSKTAKTSLTGKKEMR